MAVAVVEATDAPPVDELAALKQKMADSRTRGQERQAAVEVVWDKYRKEDDISIALEANQHVVDSDAYHLILRVKEETQTQIRAELEADRAAAELLLEYAPESDADAAAREARVEQKLLALPDSEMRRALPLFPEQAAIEN
jgi:hypothetical protein